MPKSWTAWSLRRRLVLIGGFAMLTTLLVGGFSMYWAASIEDDQMLDARLEQLGSTILSFIEHDLTEPRELQEVQHLPLATRPAAALLYRYQVWTSAGMLLRTFEAPADRSFVPLERFGFSKASINGETYRTFSLPSRDGRYVIQVAECIDERIGQIATVTGYYVGFLLLPFGLLCGTAWALLMRSMRSIDTIAIQLRERNPLDVTPLRVQSPPEEMKPILLSLETMFQRVRDAISVERRFTSVAAHEMRTPLAGLRAQAQLACSVNDPGEAQVALRSVILGVDRAAHLLSQLLDIAKIETLSKERLLEFREVWFDDVYAQLVVDFDRAACEKGITLTHWFETDSVWAQSLGMLLVMRNLVANAILYTPAGGKVHLSTRLHDEDVVLTVDDSGPGIAPHDRERAFERFNRLGAAPGHGVGLGLSIVLMVVEWHEAKIALLDSPLGGLRSQVVFQAGPCHIEHTLELAATA
jgi:two-component system OmpR family sensor kinase/two-component system sensor histidine kinase QseC